jgi:hypothetical protein
MQRFWRITIVTTLLNLGFGAFALGFDPDEIKNSLDRAKETYERELAAHRKDLLSTLEKAEDEARRNGNKKLVDQIIADREAFGQKEKLPKSIPTRFYTLKVRQSRRTLEAAFRQAVKDYTRTKQDAKAGLVEGELQDFQGHSITTC